MLTITSNEQAEELIQNGILAVDDDVEIAFDGFDIDADIKCKNIYSKDHPRNINARNIDALNIDAADINARDIEAWDIKTEGINALNINAEDINAMDIKARNIDALNIDAADINARNIDADDINALNIDAQDINSMDIKARNIYAGNIIYHAVCVAYNDIRCSAIKGLRENARHFCLDGEIIIKEPINERD